MVRKLKHLGAHVFFLLIHLVKAVFQMPHGSCRFTPSCSLYAREALETKPLFRALFLIITRVARCHPFSRGGYDPLPAGGSTMKG